MNIQTYNDSMLSTSKRRIDFKKGVSVITPTCRPKYINRIFKNFLSQRYDKKELIIVLNNNDMSIKEYKQKASSYNNIQVFQLDENKTLGQCRDFAIRNVNLDYIALFDDDDYYAPNYLSQSISIFNKIDADIIGKASFFTYFEASKTLAIYHHNRINQENQYVNHVADPSMIFKRSLYEAIGRYPNSFEDPDAIFQGNCIKLGFKIYSTDMFNFVLHRHPDPYRQHTWKISEKHLLNYCDIIGKDLTDYSKYVLR